MVPNDDLSGLVVLEDTEVRAQTKNFFKDLETKHQVRSSASANAWISACDGKRWVQDLLLDSVPDRLTGSLQRLGSLLSFLDHNDEMFSVNVPTKRGSTSWAALTYFAVKHSHDCLYRRWHHDFYSADAAWCALREGLGLEDEVARQVCATIAFQNTLRAMLHSPPLCEVGIYAPNESFCDKRERCLKRLKWVISEKLGPADPGCLYWRSCAYAALALKGRHHGSLTDKTSGTQADKDAVDEFASLMFEVPAQLPDCGLISFEYGSYVPVDNEAARRGLWEIVLDKAKKEIFPNETPSFCSISFGRHWRTSDLQRLSSEIGAGNFHVVPDQLSPSWPRPNGDLDRYFFCHVRLQDAFNLWLDARVPKPPACNGSFPLIRGEERHNEQ